MVCRIWYVHLDGSSHNLIDVCWNWNWCLWYGSLVWMCQKREDDPKLCRYYTYIPYSVSSRCIFCGLNANRIFKTVHTHTYALRRKHNHLMWHRKKDVEPLHWFIRWMQNCECRKEGECDEVNPVPIFTNLLL